MKRFAAAVVMGLVALSGAGARDLGQWTESASAEEREWFESLRRPDFPNGSCCGEADSYWADDVRLRDGKIYAVITDTRPDKPRRRPHVDPGTEIEVPREMIKRDQGNPTRHTIIFLGTERRVLCYVPVTGV